MLTPIKDKNTLHNAQIAHNAHCTGVFFISEIIESHKQQSRQADEEPGN